MSENIFWARRKTNWKTSYSDNNLLLSSFSKVICIITAKAACKQRRRCAFLEPFGYWFHAGEQIKPKKPKMEPRCPSSGRPFDFCIRSFV